MTFTLRSSAMDYFAQPNMPDFSILHTLILSVSTISVTLLLGYYLIIFRRLNARVTETGPAVSTHGVSVVICARNEEANLRAHLPIILAQEYPDFEVIVVNDASWDGTGNLLEEFQKSHPQLSVVTVTDAQKRTAGKKLALTLAFKRASKDFFLLTDADCLPAGPYWIRNMCNGVKDGMVLGYGAYKKTNGLLNRFIRFDTWSVAVQYLSAAISGNAYMGVGRNMGYSRSHYHDHGGFRSHYHIMSGDDDLMVNHTANRKNVRVRAQDSAHTISVAPDTWHDWWNQKKRHMSVSSAYSIKSKWFLGVYLSAQILFYASLTLGIILSVPWTYLLLLFGIKTTIHLLISIPHARQLKENEMLALLPFLEPVLLVMNMCIGLWSRISRPKVWK